MNRVLFVLLLVLIGACLLLKVAESVNRLLSTDMVAVAFAEGGDDAYYYLTIARNAARGAGITIDGVEWTSGIQPLWALLCAIAYLAGSDRAAFAILYLASYAFWIGGAVLLVLFVQRATRLPFPVLAIPLVAGLFLWDRQLNELYVNGMESGLYISALLLFLVVAQRSAGTAVRAPSLRHAAMMGLSAGVLMLARNDGVFVCAFVMLALLIADRSRARFYELVVAGVIACMLVLPWIAYCYWVAGLFVPQSGVATSVVLRPFTHPADTIRAFIVSFVPLLFVRMRGFLTEPPMVGGVLAVLLTIGLLVAVFRPRSRLAEAPTRLVLLAFAASNVVLLAYYPLVSSAVQFYERYFGPVKLLIVILLSLVIVAAARRFEASKAFAATASAVLVAAILSNAYWIAEPWGVPYRGYFGSSAYALARSPFMTDGSRIGMMESGRFGFMLPDRVVNLDGKMRVPALRALQQGRLDEEIQRGNFDYILLNIFDEAFFDERAPAWRQRYVPAGKLGTLAVFKRKPQ
jgi:hypothetical protein